MSSAVISYTLGGNNEALAKSVAQKIGAEHIKITEPKKRTMGKTAMDMMMNRTPKTSEVGKDLDGYDMVYVFGPVWMGNVASPLRSFLAEIGKAACKYSFVSICGGADGDNPGIAEDLKKRTGREPEAVIEMHIADLLPSEPKPERKDTMAYKLSEDEVEKLAGEVAIKLG